MSGDDRFDEIKRLLDSTIGEFQTLFQSAGGFEDSRVGNGWDPDRISTDVFYLQPKPIEEIEHVAESRKHGLFDHKVVSFLRHREDIRLSERPTLKLIPYWRVKGFHECFYFRGNSYRINLPDDVVAVEVEGKIRDIVGQDYGDSQTLVGFTRRLLGRKSLDVNKHFRLGDVTELAYMYKEGSLFVDSEGKEDLEAEAFFEGKIPLLKTTLPELLKLFPNAVIVPTTVGKEDLVRRLHSMVVKAPTAFTKILSNRFQITELAQYLMPVYLFRFESRGHAREISIHGYTGAIFQ